MKQNTDTRKLFNFYTYDPTGRDVVIPIRGIDENDAYETFRKLYTHRDGSYFVYQIIEVK